MGVVGNLHMESSNLNIWLAAKIVQSVAAAVDVGHKKCYLSPSMNQYGSLAQTLNASAVGDINCISYRPDSSKRSHHMLSAVN